MQNNMFLITPMTQKISLNKGEIYQGHITIANPSNSTQDFKYKTSISPYGVAGEDYDADLATKSNHTMIADWITLENSSGTLSPNDTGRVNFTITVPETAPAGAQYAAIIVSQSDDTISNRGVNIDDIFEMASIIYADIAGETTHEGSILENTIPGFTTDGQLIVSARINNHGNVHEEAIVTITVQNTITGETILPTSEFNGKYNELILPDTTKHITRNINDLPLLGIVNVTQTIHYNSEVSEISQTVIICPLWFIFTALTTIAIIIAIIVRHIFKRRQSLTI